MKKITTLEEALKRIEKLEKENADLKEANADLKEELEYFRKRKACGRQRHNAKWMAIYNDFVALLEVAFKCECERRAPVLGQHSFTLIAFLQIDLQMI